MKTKGSNWVAAFLTAAASPDGSAGAAAAIALVAEPAMAAAYRPDPQAHYWDGWVAFLRRGIEGGGFEVR